MVAPDQETVRRIFDYDPERGILIWKPRPASHRGASIFNTRYAGSVAGALRPDGYCHVAVNGHTRLMHRVIWTWLYGEWPTKQVDHIDGDRSNNRPENLRLADASEQQQNITKRSHNTSGFLGVHWSKKDNRWIAYITAERKRRVLGYFREKDDAVKAYVEAKAILHTFQPTERHPLAAIR